MTQANCGSGSEPQPINATIQASRWLRRTQTCTTTVDFDGNIGCCAGSGPKWFACGKAE